MLDRDPDPGAPLRILHAGITRVNSFAGHQFSPARRDRAVQAKSSGRW
jgi:hypothetical protein